ncbi:hypothetical protein IMZ48_04105, partial [Candidatus Bathyarchaeota archaeon]|nr:hypothetical protein [Candidatus Bathyarchaeota archaeon]
MAVMLFLFVPETFWDRSPVPRPRSRGSSVRPSFMRRISSRYADPHHQTSARPSVAFEPRAEQDLPGAHPAAPAENAEKGEGKEDAAETAAHVDESGVRHVGFDLDPVTAESGEKHQGSGEAPPEPASTGGKGSDDANERSDSDQKGSIHTSVGSGAVADPARQTPLHDAEKAVPDHPDGDVPGRAYTHALRHLPAKTFRQQLRPYHGRLSQDSWFTVMVRPFILFTYPAILWSAAVYACSIGWLIVISE